jgi:hypothetical protein
MFFFNPNSTLSDPSTLPCTCDPPILDGHPYIQWIGTIFGDCVRTPVEITSFALGLVSLFCYIIALFPQMVSIDLCVLLPIMPSAMPSGFIRVKEEGREDERAYVVC